MTDTAHHATPSRADIVDRLTSVGLPAHTANGGADDFLAAAANLAANHRAGYLARMVAGEELRAILTASRHPVTTATRGADTAVLVPTGTGRWHGPECGYDTISWVRAAVAHQPSAHQAGRGLLGELVALLNDADEPVITHRWAFILHGRPVTPDRFSDPAVRATVRSGVAALLEAPDPLDVHLRGITLDPAGGRLG